MCFFFLFLIVDDPHSKPITLIHVKQISVKLMIISVLSGSPSLSFFSMIGIGTPWWFSIASLTQKSPKKDRKKKKNTESQKMSAMHYKCCECVITIRSGRRENNDIASEKDQSRSDLNKVKIHEFIIVSRFHELTRPTLPETRLNKTRRSKRKTQKKSWCCSKKTRFSSFSRFCLVLKIFSRITNEV